MTKLSTGARDDPADRVGEQARVVLAHLDPVPERDRRDAAREVLRQVRLIAAEDRDGPLRRAAQRLVQRRVDRDRDADEPRLERERDERRDGEPRAAAVDLGDDDRDAGGPAPEQGSLLGPALLVHDGEPSYSRVPDALRREHDA